VRWPSSDRGFTPSRTLPVGLEGFWSLVTRASELSVCLGIAHHQRENALLLRRPFPHSSVLKHIVVLVGWLTFASLVVRGSDKLHEQHWTLIIEIVPHLSLYFPAHTKKHRRSPPQATQVPTARPLLEEGGPRAREEKCKPCERARRRSPSPRNASSSRHRPSRIPRPWQQPRPPMLLLLRRWGRTTNGFFLPATWTCPLCTRPR
jgi:hypothetical protein